MHETFTKKIKIVLTHWLLFPCPEISRALGFFFFSFISCESFQKRIGSRNERKWKALKAPEVILGNLEW